MDPVYRVPTLYPVDIDENKPTFALGIPSEVIRETVYESIEVNHLLGFGYFRPMQDTETNRDFLLFKRNIEANPLKKEYCAAVIDIMTQSRALLDEIIGRKSITELEKDDDPLLFWRTITSLDPEIITAVPPELHDCRLDSAFHGGHIRLEQRAEKAFLRIKTRSLEELERITTVVFQSIAQNT